MSNTGPKSSIDILQKRIVELNSEIEWRRGVLKKETIRENIDRFTRNIADAETEISYHTRAIEFLLEQQQFA